MKFATEHYKIGAEATAPENALKTTSFLLY